MIVNEQVAVDHGLKKDEYAKKIDIFDKLILFFDKNS